jgi:spermidine synthase
VYVLESFGSIFGGVLLTFVLVQRFDSVSIALGVSLCNALIALILIRLKPRQPNPSASRAVRVLRTAAAFLTASCALLLFSPLGNWIHRSSIRIQWRGLELIDVRNSIYGNITVTSTGAQRTFFTDGVPAVTVPVPDIAAIEDFAHIPLLLHPRPRSVLIASGGAGGLIREVLKHPVRRIDYVELDPLLLKLVMQHGSPLSRQELTDPRVEIHYQDARVFISRTDRRFDVLLVGLGMPQELQTNRLFSAEFFAAAKEKLEPHGLIALALPGSTTYMGEELRTLNGCLLDTLESVFARVRIIPGDENLYIASDSPELVHLGADELAVRFAKRGIQAKLVSPTYLAYRLQPQWLSAYTRAVDPLPRRINSDFRPLAVFYGLSYWNALYSPYLRGLFQGIERTRLPAIMILIAIVTGLMTAALFLGRDRRRTPLPYAIASTGFCGMVFDLAIIFTFQSLFGYLYYQIGVLVTVFMAGTAISSLLVTRRLERRPMGAGAFLAAEACLVGFAVLLPWVFSVPSRPLHLLFILMSFTSGALTGFQFPLAARLHLRAGGMAGNPPGRSTAGAGGGADGEVSHTAGVLYGADLLGGYFGGLVGGVVLLPILGLWATCLILGAIKAGSLLLNLVYFRGGTKQRTSG